MYIYIYIHIYIHEYMYVYIYIYKCIHVYTPLRACALSKYVLLYV